MFGLTKNVLSCIIILLSLNNNGVRGEDQCDPNISVDEKIETFRSATERTIQIPGAIMGDGSNDSDDDGEGSSLIVDTFNAVMDKLQVPVLGFIPGTLWCGKEDFAPNSSYLGPCDDTDACCRDHDHCSPYVVSGDSYGPLKNNGIFARMSCECDHAFYECLKKANSAISAGVGHSYFNVFRPQCFTCEYPIVGCAEGDESQMVEKKCLAYKLDTNQNKTLQWFDNMNF